MLECLETLNVNLNNWTKSNLFSVVSGIFFAVGWWVMIDSAVSYPSKEEFNPIFHICGVMSTVGFILINLVPLSAVRGDEDDDSCTNAGPKFIFFISCVMLFASVIVSSYILIGVYIVAGKHPIWPGVAVFTQNLFILVASLIFKLCRASDDID